MHQLLHPSDLCAFWDTPENQCGKTLFLQAYPQCPTITTETGSLDTTPVLGSDPPASSSAPADPPSTHRSPPQHKQQHVVTHSTLCVSAGSRRLATGCVYHQTHMSA